MKSLVLLLIAASLAVSPSTVLLPGNGDAAAAVAAQNKGAMHHPLGGTQEGGFVFALSGSGKCVHVEGGAVAGNKPFKNTIKDDDLASCIAGVGNGCDANSLDINTDPDAGLFLIYNGPDEWALANNPAGDDAVSLTGVVDGKGGFMMAGVHTATDGDSQFFFSGKVLFEKGTLNPKKISGKFTAVKTVPGEEHYGSGSFKAVPFVN